MTLQVDKDRSDFLNFTRFKDLLSQLYFINKDKLTPSEEHLVQQMWSDDLKVRSIEDEEVCDVRNILILAAGILNLQVSAIKRNAAPSMIQTMDDRNGNDPIRPSLNLKIIENSDSANESNLIKFETNIEIEQCHMKYISLCNNRKVIKRKLNLEPEQHTFHPHLCNNSIKILNGTSKLGSRRGSSATDNMPRHERLLEFG